MVPAVPFLQKKKKDKMVEKKEKKIIGLGPNVCFKHKETDDVALPPKPVD